MKAYTGRVRVLFVTFFLSFLLGCATQRSRIQELKTNDVKLLNKSSIVDADSGEPIGLAQVIKRVRSADIILIGEIHDNAYHHLAQALIIRKIAKDRGKLAVGFEHIRASKNDSIQKFTLHHPENYTGFRVLLDWEGSGWPHWMMFEPLFEAAVLSKSSILGLDLGFHQLQALRQGDIKGFKEADLRKINFDQGLPKKMQDELMKELKSAHDFPMTEDILNKMQLIQRARDLKMATEILLALRKSDQVVAVMGAGHARKDRGVPYYLNKLSEKKLLSIGLSIREDRELPVPTLPIDTQPERFDILWLTPPWR